jgi:hypothetical protein
MSERRMWPSPNAIDATMKATRRTESRGRHATQLSHLANSGLIQLDDWAAPAVSSQLTLFAEAFPASRTVSLADVPAPPTSATSGPSSSDSFASVDPDGSWRKTCQGYSQVTLDGSLARFSETWPRAGMTRSGTAYRRPPLAPLTDGTASGLWPTPDAGVANIGEQPDTYLTRRAELVKKGSCHGMGYSLGIAAQMWPTPCAEDAKNVPYQKGKAGQRYPMLLGAVRPDKMWPTASARDWKDSPGMARTGTNPDGSLRSREDQLARAVYADTANGGALNPTWVEWLMGYPLGWTACAAWGTASSRKSRSGSRGGS